MDLGFHAINYPLSKMDEIFGGTDGTLHIEVTTKSGRTFRYEVADIRFGPGITPQEAECLAEQILAEKYRYCAWDRAHQEVVSVAEIAAELVKLILWCAEQMRSL